MKFTTASFLSMPLYLQAVLAAPQAGIFCNFFSERDCNGNSSIGYSVNNNGCFSVSGKSVWCHGLEFAVLNPRLIQTPEVNNQNCRCQSHCKYLDIGLRFCWNVYSEIKHKTCWNLEDEGFNMNYNVWRFIHDGRGCDVDNC